MAAERVRRPTRSRRRRRPTSRTPARTSSKAGRRPRTSSPSRPGRRPEASASAVEPPAAEPSGPFSTAPEPDEPSRSRRPIAEPRQRHGRGRARAGRGGRRRRSWSRAGARAGRARSIRRRSRTSTRPGELEVPPGYGVLEGVPDGSRRAVGIVVSRFNGEITSRLLASALEELERAGVAAERRHGDARAGCVRAADRRDGARADAAVRLHRRARLRHPRRHAALRLRRERGGERACSSRRSRPACPGLVRRAHARARGSGRGADRARAPKRYARRSRWPTSSRTSAQPPPR